MNGSASLHRLSFTLAVVALAGCAARPAGHAPRLLDATPRVAIVSAFDAELASLRAAAEITGEWVVNGRTHYVGRLAGREVVLLLSGYSIVNAAMNTQALLDRFRVREIVFSGIAGGVNPELRLGDVAVPARWGNYQEQVFARETDAGWDPARLDGEFPNFGMMVPQPSSVVVPGGAPDHLERRFWFTVDAGLLEAARRAADGVRLARCSPRGDCLEHQPRVVTGGNGVSGPTFVDNAAYRRWVWDAFRADALDMETAAVAQVAYVNHVPFIAFRSLSDLAGGGGSGANEARVFGALAAENAARVVVEFLKLLPVG